MNKGRAILWSNHVAILTSLLIAFVASLNSLRGGALEDFLAKPDTNFAWTVVTNRQVAGTIATQLKVTSQRWRETNWTHHVQVVRPEKLRHPEFGFLFITGDGDGRSSIELLKTLADRAGAVAA